MISHRYQCIFVEVPKTGSTSIRAIIGAPTIPHLDIYQIRAEIEGAWSGQSQGSLIHRACQFLPHSVRSRKAAATFQRYFKFGFVRNPWDRVVSLFERNEGIQVAGKMNFPEFVDWIQLSSDTCKHPTPKKNQLDWFTDGAGTMLMDFIGRFESLQQDWAHIARRIGADPELPHHRRNPKPRRHYTEYYTSRTREIIRQKFARDIEYFGYEFDGATIQAA